MNPTVKLMLIAGGGLTVAGLFALRHAIRTAVPEEELLRGNKADRRRPPARALVLPGRCGVCRRGRCAWQELRREEQRQRPWEGRN